MSLTASIAYVCPDRQMHTLSQPGAPAICVTNGIGDLSYATWGASTTRTNLHSWPTWSPSGDRVACFRMSDDGRSGARIFVAHPDGIRSTELSSIETKIPIYLQWSPEGSKLAVLSQKDDLLRLSHVDADGTGTHHNHLAGSPLFFTWTHENTLAAFTGGVDTSAKMVLLDLPEGKRRFLPGRPCNFCAPVWTGTQLIYAAHHNQRVSILVTDLTAMTVRELEVIDGLAALVASPNGRILARALADDDRSPYRSLALIDLDTGALRTLLDIPCTAFFWLPAGEGLVVAQTHADTGVVSWIRVGLDGFQSHLIDIKPTRDTRFYLRFFEQYSESHPLIDPTGRFLLTAGTLDGIGTSGGPRLWQVPLNGGAPEDLGEALFGVYGPALQQD